MNGIVDSYAYMCVGEGESMYICNTQVIEPEQPFVYMSRFCIVSRLVFVYR